LSVSQKFLTKQAQKTSFKVSFQLVRTSYKQSFGTRQLGPDSDPTSARQVTASVADVYLGSESFSIPDPTKKEQGKNKLVVLPVLVDNYLIFFEQVPKKI
jgi:hypothetical protein